MLSPTTSVETTDSEYDEEEMEEMEEWLSTAYERASNPAMKMPFTESWGLPITDADVEKLKVGFKSQSMDDKWDILIEEPDEKGHMSVHIIRNWFQEDCYVLHIVPKQQSDDGGSAKIQSITWEGNKSGLHCGAEQAKKEAVMLCRGRLDCKFEALPHYPYTMFWDSSAYMELDES